MKKIPIIAALSALCSIMLLAVSLPVFAADNGTENNPEPVILEPMVVTATRWETSRQDIAANIEVITRAEIEKLPATTVAEVLKYIPGVYVEFNGGPGSFAGGIRIQGSETRHVAVFQDGVPLNQLINPATDLSYLPVDAIERIEVYKGAASSAWGSALGGVINIITKDPEPGKRFAGDTRASYGEFDTFKSRAGLSGTIDRFAYMFSVTHEKSDGFIPHTEYDQDALYAKLGYDVGDSGRLSLIVSYDEGRNADPLLIFPSFWDDIARKRVYQALILEVEPANGWTVSLEGRHHRWNIFIEDVFPDHRELFNDYEDDTWGGGARLTCRIIPNHIINFGFDGNSGRYDWNNYDRTYDADNWAVYANDTVRLGAFSINAGLRYDEDNTFGNAVSPAGGIVYRFWQERVSIRLQAARGFSAPPASWAQDPVFGNPDLKPETAVNFQLGGDIRPVEAVVFEWNVFRADVDDLILFNRAIRKWENIDEVIRQGVEGAVRVSLPLELTVSFSGSYVDVRNDQTDEVIEDIPRTLLTVQAGHRYGRFSHTLTGTYTDHNSSFPETEDSVFIFDYLFNLKLPSGSFPVEPALYGAVYNLFDTDYIYRDTWPKPPRWVEAGVRFTF